MIGTSVSHNGRRVASSMLSRTLAALALLFTAALPAGSAQPADRYAVVRGWPVMPEGYVLGQATGVGVDSHNHVFVFHRAGRMWSDPFPDDFIPHATVAVFDGATGAHVGEWGSNQFVMPHGLTIDPDDNVWLTDVGSHQVFKFSHDGKLLMTLGTARVAGDDAKHFNLPTDVAVRADGGFYVSDGYANTRVLSFGADGTFLSQWGVKGSGAGEFDLPHGLALDAAGRVYVADRANARVQVFDAGGTFLSQWNQKELGRPYAVAIGPDGKAYVVDGGDQPQTLPDRSRAMRLSLDGRIESVFGRYGNYDGQFMLGHDIAVGRDGAVYVVDAWGQRVQKFEAPAG
jgi:peptidylamidoglycolate lyase